MKNRRYLCIAALFLVVAMLTPLMASCQHEAAYDVTEVPVYTIYTIKDDYTTDAAIMQVELALNRLLFYRLGVCVKLMLYNEDEYEQAIKDKVTELEEYTLAKEAEKKNTSAAESDASEAASGNVSEDIRTGDKLLSDLAAGIPTELKSPRLDLFLVRGYSNYAKYVSEGLLTALDEKLSSEAKLIKDYVHPSFFSAAKIGGKTYGVPCNTAIGEYEYIVFDKELLDRYGFDAQTMSSVDDLREYLDIIKEKEPDVIPLQTATDSNEYAFMFENGFATFVDDTKHVVSSYEDQGLLEYLAMIARYNSLGYLENAAGKTYETDPDTRFAVSFVKGNERTISDLEKANGREYAYNVYQVPTATNENSIDSIFCVSKYCISNELIDVMELLTMLFTDPEIQNLLTYGVQNVSYILNDEGQVEYINDVDNPDVPESYYDNYRMDRNYTGNSFIAYTVKGEDVNMWDSAKKQNLASVVSNTLGFSVTQKSFTYKDENGVKQTIYEPDYCSILTSVIANYYPTLMHGTSVDFDLEEFTATATEEVRQSIRDTLISDYETRYKAEVTASIRASYSSTEEAQTLYKAAETKIRNSVIRSLKKKLTSVLTKELTEKYEKEGTEKTEDEIEEEVKAILEDEDYINEHINDEYSDEEIQANIDSEYEKQIKTELNKLVNAFIEGDEYKAKIAEFSSTDEFNTAVEEQFAKTGVELVNSTIDTKIATEIKAISDSIITDFNTKIEEAVTQFVADNKEILDMSEDELLTEIGYEQVVVEKDEEGNPIEPEEGEEPTYEAAYDSFYEFVWQGKIRKQYYSTFGDPDAVAA